MTKRLFLFILAFVSMFSVAQARFYLGVEGGFASQGLASAQVKGKGLEAHTISTGGLGDLIRDGAKGYSVSIVFGTENFFTKYFGLRWGLGLGYSSTEKDLMEGIYKRELEFNTITSDLSFDLMLNFVNTGSFSFGIFGGVGAEYQYFTNAGKPRWHALGFEGRAGLSALLGGHHRLEVFTKLPFAEVSAKATKGDDHLLVYNVSKAVIGASYKFVF